MADELRPKTSTRGTSALQGALQYGMTGAGIGAAAAGPLGAAIGGGVGAVAGGVTGALTGGRSKAQRQYDKAIRADFKALQEGRLGLDKAQRQGLMAEATRSQGALQSAQQAQVARAGLAGTDPGAFAEAQREIALAGASGAAGASRDINALDERLRESAYNRIMGQYGLLGERDVARRAAAGEEAQTAIGQGVIGIDALIKEAQARRKAGSEAVTPGTDTIPLTP